MKMAEPIHVKVYKYRWIILILFAVSATINFIQFLQYSIISNITQKYYNVSSTTVQLSGLMYQIIFILLCLPGNYLIERYNLKMALIASTGLTAVGTLLKILAVNPERYYLVILAQILCAIGHVVILSVPAKLASTWFGPKEVSTAAALAIFGAQIGLAIGCVWPSNAVRNSDNLKDIEDDFWVIMIINACLACFWFVLVAIFFKAKPELPPSQSEANLLVTERISLIEILKTMFKSYDYWILILTFGLAVGIWTSNGLVINQVYLNYFPGEESTVGILTAVSIITGGCFGSVIFGFILDKYHKYKLTAFVALLGSALTYIFVIITLEFETILGTYFTIPIFGFFMGPCLLISYEFATESTYPLPASISCAVINSLENVFAILFTFVIGELFDVIGYLYTYVFGFCVLLVSCVVIWFASPNLHRHNANNLVT